MLVLIIVLLLYPERESLRKPKETFPVKIVHFLPHEIDDGSWNQMGYEAMQKIAEEQNLQVLTYAKTSPAMVDSIVSSLKHEKSLFVVAHGGEYVNALEPVALKYPHYKFGVVGHYAGNGRNYGSITTGVGFCYLAGALAAMKSKSGHIGLIAGQDLKHIVSQYHAFVSGAKDINPAIKTSVRYVGSWEDKPLSLKLANELISANVDVMMINVDKVSPAIHSLARDNNILSISVTTDERKNYPGSVIAAVMTDFPKMMNIAIKLFILGKWEGKLNLFGLTEGATFVELDESAYSDEQKQRYNDLYAKLIQKQISIPDYLE